MEAVGYVPVAIAALAGLVFVFGLLHVWRGHRLARKRARQGPEALSSDRLASIDRFVR